jgi:hypothetical protein
MGVLKKPVIDFQFARLCSRTILNGIHFMGGGQSGFIGCHKWLEPLEPLHLLDLERI